MQVKEESKKLEGLQSNENNQINVKIDHKESVTPEYKIENISHHSSSKRGINLIQHVEQNKIIEISDTRNNQIEIFNTNNQPSDISNDTLAANDLKGVAKEHKQLKESYKELSFRQDNSFIDPIQNEEKIGYTENDALGVLNNNRGQFINKSKSSHESLAHSHVMEISPE